MGPNHPIIAAAFLLVCITFGSAQNNDPLQKCWSAQGEQLGNKFIDLRFSEQRHELEHSFQPWQQSTYKSSGRVWCSGEEFRMADTLLLRGKTYYSTTRASQHDLLFIDYGDKELFPVTESMFAEQIFKTIRYSPTPLISYFARLKPAQEIESDDTYAIYSRSLSNAIVKLYVRRSDNRLHKITTLRDDELFGDVQTSYIYEDYVRLKNVYHPRTVYIQKLYGKLTDTVRISRATLADTAPELLTRPEKYGMKKDTVAL